jgi:hypothetical protein
MRFRVLDGGSWRVHALAGAAIASLLDAEETVGSERLDITAAVRSQETSAVVGAEIQIGRRLTVDVRYLHGTSNVYEAASFPAKSRTLEILAGYRVR